MKNLEADACAGKTPPSGLKTNDSAEKCNSRDDRISVLPTKTQIFAQSERNDADKNIVQNNKMVV